MTNTSNSAMASGQTFENSIQSLAHLATAMRGLGPLEAGLRALVEMQGAEAALLTRQSMNRERPEIAAKAIRSASSVRAVNRAFCNDVADTDPWRLREGAVQALSQTSEMSERARDALATWRKASGTREIVVIVLEVTRDHVDRLELHFRAPLAQSEITLWETMGDALPMIYAARRPGLVGDCIQRSQRAGAGLAKPSGPVLLESNPYGLTRCEFRLCLMISRGYSYKRLADELDVSQHTVRSHLRNIYAKLDVSDFYDLSHRLVSIEEIRASETGRQVAA